MSKNNYIETDLARLAKFRYWQYYLSFLLGAITVLAFAPVNLWFLAIITPAAMLYFWYNTTPKHAFYTGWLYGAGLFGFGASWIFISIHRFGGAPLWLSVLATALFVAVLGLYYGIAGFVMRKWLSRNPALTCLCAFPAVWTAVEYLRGILFTGFPWLSLGYTQTNSPLASIAGLFGIYGVTLALTLMAGCIVALLLHLSKRTDYWACALLLIILGLAIGFHSKSWTTVDGAAHSVSLVQGNIAQTVKWQPGELETILKTYLSLSSPEWNNRLILWPEAAIPTVPQNIPAVISGLTRLATQSNSELLTGIPLYNSKTGDYFNGALLLGATTGRYAKRHLVPFGEYFPLQSLFGWFYSFTNIPMSNFTQGPPKQPLLFADNMYIAPYICYEIAFPQEVLQTLNNANLIVVLTDDSWFGDSLASAQHLQIAQMRAIETGRYLLFNSNNGPSAIIGPKGKVLAQSVHGQALALNGTVYSMIGATPYMILGNHPVWLFITLMLAIVILVRKESTLAEEYS
jgi:apolipoprotein N-acyltransferase